MTEIAFPKDETAPCGHGMRCKAAKRNGDRCGNVAVLDSDFCRVHIKGYKPARKHGLYSQILGSKEEIADYEEALKMSDAKKLEHMAAVVQAKIKTFFREHKNMKKDELEAVNRSIGLYKELVRHHHTITKGIDDADELDLAKALSKVKE